MPSQTSQPVVEITLPRTPVAIDTSTCIPATHRQVHESNPYTMEPSTCLAESHHLSPTRLIETSVISDPKLNRSHQDDINHVQSLLHQRAIDLEKDQEYQPNIHISDDMEKGHKVHYDLSLGHQKLRLDDVGEAESPQNWMTKFRHSTREFWAEFFGTLILMLFGIGVNLQTILSTSTAVSGAPTGNWMTICFGWGVGLMSGLYISSGVSGGHLNPAVTLSLAIFRGFRWKKVPIYIMAQFLGAFLGTALVYVNYARAIRLFEGGSGIKTMKTGGLFFSAPLDYVTNLNCFYEEFLGTVILLIFILAVNDGGNMAPPVGIAPFVMLWVLFAIGATTGMQTSFSLNPARDFGPRLLCWLLGYGNGIWTYRHIYWIWGTTLTPICGAIVGCALYDGLIGSDFVDSPMNKIFSRKRQGKQQQVAHTIQIQEA